MLCTATSYHALITVPASSCVELCCSSQGRSLPTSPLHYLVTNLAYFFVWTTMLPPPMGWLNSLS
jgi:hypothetical protein